MDTVSATTTCGLSPRGGGAIETMPPVRLSRALSVLYYAQGGYCAGCGQLVRRRGRAKRPAWVPSFDHVIPRSKGGTRVLTNGLLKHTGCNGARGDRAARGCDLLWQQVVLVALDVACARVDRESAVAQAEAKQRKLENEAISREMKLRTVHGFDGDRYRLWGVVRCTAARNQNSERDTIPVLIASDPRGHGATRLRAGSR